MCSETVRLPDGSQRLIADNQQPYHLNCPIDGTQLAKRCEINEYCFDCVTCHLTYESRRSEITQEQLDNTARSVLSRTRMDLDKIAKEKEKLEKLLDFAKRNNFE